MVTMFQSRLHQKPDLYLRKIGFFQGHLVLRGALFLSFPPELSVPGLGSFQFAFIKDSVILAISYKKNNFNDHAYRTSWPGFIAPCPADN